MFCDDDPARISIHGLHPGESGSLCAYTQETPGMSVNHKTHHATRMQKAEILLVSFLPCIFSQTHFIWRERVNKQVTEAKGVFRESYWHQTSDWMYKDARWFVGVAFTRTNVWCEYSMIKHAKSRKITWLYMKLLQTSQGGNMALFTAFNEKKQPWQKDISAFYFKRYVEIPWQHRRPIILYLHNFCKL